jgi:hypothetical protein
VNSSSWLARRIRQRSLQLRVLGFGLLQDGDVGVGAFPQREEILIGGASFGRVALHGIGSADLEMRECSDGFVEHDSAMVEDFLELGGGAALFLARKCPLTASRTLRECPPNDHLYPVLSCRDGHRKTLTD